jgi:hypothetical protein
MTTIISAQITAQGLLIPRTAKQVLEQSGRLVNLDWPQTTPPLTDQERAELAQKFGGGGRPLSEIIIEKRGEP